MRRLFLLFFATPVFASTLCVESSAPESGTLYLYIATESEFETPFTGSCLEIREVEQGEAFTVCFEVTDSEYAARAFIDQNGDGKLNRVAWRPTEPWAISWRERARSIPKFEDASFTVCGDTVIELQFEND